MHIYIEPFFQSRQRFFSQKILSFSIELIELLILIQMNTQENAKIPQTTVKSGKLPRSSIKVIPVRILSILCLILGLFSIGVQVSQFNFSLSFLQYKIKKKPIFLYKDCCPHFHQRKNVRRCGFLRIRRHRLWHLGRFVVHRDWKSRSRFNYKKDNKNV